MTQQNILITGASSGIGKETAMALARSGYTVFAGVRSEKDAQDLAKEGLNNLKPLILDVTKSEQIDTAFEFLKTACGSDGLMGLINNAGINYMSPFEISDETKERQLMEVNVFGLINLTKKMLPLLQNYVEKGRSTAKIVNIGSIGSVLGIPWQYSYHVSKFAVWGLSQSLRYELAPLSIKVSCVMPGGVKTPFFQKAEQSGQFSSTQINGKNGAYYLKNLNNMEKNAKQFEGFATHPSVLAAKIGKIIASKNPPAKILIGVDAKIINFMMWLGLGSLFTGQFVKK
jgi:short-subunit dehydrogenase